MKYNIPLLGLLLIISATSHAGQNTPLLDKTSFSLHEEEAPNKLKNKIRSILTYFFHGWDDPKATKEIRELIPKIINNSLKNKRNYKIKKCYSEELTLEQMIQETINGRRQKAYNYALKITNNKKIAQKVRQRITDQLLKRFGNQKRLHDFFGQALENKVNHIVHILQAEKARKDAEKAVKEEKPKLYPSDDCCICFASLKAHNRVFLKPCGHDLCKRCFKRYKEKCAQCRATVKGTINPPAAQAYNPAAHMG